MNHDVQGHRTHTFHFSLLWEVRRGGQWWRRGRGRTGRGSATSPQGAEQSTICDFHFFKDFHLHQEQSKEQFVTFKTFCHGCPHPSFHIYTYKEQVRQRKEQSAVTFKTFHPISLLIISYICTRSGEKNNK